jgi:DNA-binding transcriptional LysR family regulator
VETSVDLRQLRYFVAVAEELHFGRAAERLHMSQSPLSRAIRDLERELDVVLFVRTTRSVELTAAGLVLLERSRKALTEIDGAIADTRRAMVPDSGAVGIGYGPFSGTIATRIAAELADRGAAFSVRLDEEVTPDSLRRLAVRQLAAALVMETPGAARRHGRSRTRTPAPRRFRSQRSWRSESCFRASRPGRHSTPGFGRSFAPPGSSSTARWRH